MDFEEILRQRLAETEFELNDIQIAQLVRYYEMLVETNKVMNLTALTEPEDVAVKHFIDSLTAYQPAMQGATLADVGTGAGFPGVVLKIYDPTLDVTLIDALDKRLRWLDNVIAELGLMKIRTLHARAEDAGRDKNLRERFQFVTARAVARLSVLAEYCLPLVRVGGVFVAMKADAAAELAEAQGALKLLGGQLTSRREVMLPGLDDKRTIVEVRKISPTNKKYPRKAGMPAKSPLATGFRVQKNSPSH